MVDEMTALEKKKQHLGSCVLTKREENYGLQMNIYN